MLPASIDEKISKRENKRKNTLKMKVAQKLSMCSAESSSTVEVTTEPAAKIVQVCDAPIVSASLTTSSSSSGARGWGGGGKKKKVCSVDGCNVLFRSINSLRVTGIRFTNLFCYLFLVFILFFFCFLAC